MRHGLPDISFLSSRDLLRELVARDVVRHVVIRLMLNRTTNVGVTGRVRSWTDDLSGTTGRMRSTSRSGCSPPMLAEVVALGAGGNDEGLPMDARRPTACEEWCSGDVALSYRADQPSTDVVAICDGDTYRYEHGTLSSRKSGVQEVDVAASFAAAVERQDAAFVEAASRGAQSPLAPARVNGPIQDAEPCGREIRLRLQSAISPRP